jgi:hypothetical protein
MKKEVRHSRESGNPAQKYPAQRQNFFVPLREASSINWIPAFAGMTELKE